MARGVAYRINNSGRGDGRGEGRGDGRGEGISSSRDCLQLLPIFIRHSLCIRKL